MKLDTVTRYNAPAQLLHWLTALIVLIAFIYGPGGSEERVYSEARDFDRQVHETLGLCVLVLLLIRILWRAFDTHPKPPPTPKWASNAASVVHATLYGLLFALPLTAISGAWLEGHSLTLLGGITVPPLLVESHALGTKVAELHTWLGDAIIWLAGLHAGAGLFHHYILKDNVLNSMLPSRNQDEK